MVEGVGLTDFGRFPEVDLADLGAAAAGEAIADAALEVRDVDAVWCGNVLGGGSAGQRTVSKLGLVGIPVTNLENACASGSHAFAAAADAVRSGRVNTALVLGVEKTSGVLDGLINLPRTDLPTRLGLTLPGVYAMNASRYLWRYGATVEALAAVSVKNRANGARNPHAMFRSVVDLAQVLASRPVADPLTLLQCCANADGAAAVVLRADRGGDGIEVLGCGVSSGYPLDAGYDLTTSRITARAAARAYQQAAIGPGEIDVAEVHDAFTIGELIALESLGLCPPGEAWKWTVEGRSATTGTMPVNPGGGLLSRGHAVGASGVAQIVELVSQLRGCARNQVAHASRALAHTVGGGMATHDGVAAVVSLLARAGARHQ